MGEMNQKDKILKLMTFIKLYSTMKILKEDNKPVELVDNLYIGSIGAAHNKKSFKREWYHSYSNCSEWTEAAFPRRI